MSFTHTFTHIISTCTVQLEEGAVTNGYERKLKGPVDNFSGPMSFLHTLSNITKVKKHRRCF
jgi:hypothetical protein